MRSDWASIPTRGSRFVGLDSMIMTSVLGSGLVEQETRAKSREVRQQSKERRQSAAVAASGRLVKSEHLPARSGASEAGYAYEIFPNTAARFAPVADGTFEGRRCHVS